MNYGKKFFFSGIKCVVSEERNSTFWNNTKQQQLKSYLYYAVIIFKASRSPGRQDISGSTNTVNKTAVYQKM